MAEKRVERRLVAILAGDVAGYSRLVGADEEATLESLNSHRREFLEPKLPNTAAASSNGLATAY